MRTLLGLGILGLVVTLAPAVVRADTTRDEKSIATVTVEQLASLRSAGKAVVIDANGTDTRQQYGVIPGAVLLSHYEQYDVTKELPRDHAAKLVFYCANEKCGASHKAAARASAAGYADVSILPAGIMGWKHAGQPTDGAGS